MRVPNPALHYKLAKPAESWEEAEAAARALKPWRIAIEIFSDRNGPFQNSMLHGRRELERMIRAVSRVGPPGPDN